MSVIQQEYENLPYPHYVHPLADVARLSALGQILGVETTLPSTARVLDIGCGSASSLLALAARLPGGKFLGIDFSAPDIASAKALAKDAGLTNIEFQQADILEWETEEKFDYIIAYGFFSWVPDAVKDRLFKVVSQCLAPQGIACISYMTYPGCKQAEALRDLLRLHTKTVIDPGEKIVTTHATLDFLDHAWAALPGLPHSGYMREEARRIRGKEAHYLLLDDLGVERDPCYLLQFTNWAAEHGLRYLGESEFHTMLPENLPKESAKELAAMKLDRLETEQMIDYVINRTFRCTLLVEQDAKVAEGGLKAEALQDLCLQTNLQFRGNARPGMNEAKFQTANNSKVTLRTVPLVEFMLELTRHPGEFTPFQDILATVEEKIGRVFSEMEKTRLCEDLLTLLGKRQLEVSSLPFRLVRELPERPCLSAFNQVMARERALVVTPFQTSLRLTADEQAFCAQLNGTQTREELCGGPLAKKESFLQLFHRLGCLSMPPNE